MSKKNTKEVASNDKRYQTRRNQEGKEEKKQDRIRK